MSDELTGTNRELIIGLIAPIGVDLNAVQRSLETALSTLRYRSTSIRLTDRLKPNYSDHTVAGKGLYDRYASLIQQGNDLRTGSVPEVFGLVAISSIIEERLNKPLSTNDRHTFILRQFKRPEEVAFLKKIYGSNLVLISCYAPKKIRIRYFADKFQSESRSINRTKHESQALDLISMDEHQPDNDNGQRLLDTYAKADFIIDASSPQTLSSSTSRFIQAFFGDPFISPSRDEYGAFMANAASLRSTDLSRQVGAAIFQLPGEIIALGCNEVPKAGGGTYWTGDVDDARDHVLGFDSNVRLKTDIIANALSELIKSGWTAPAEKNPNQLSRAMINDILEFGRVIHAEMNAITDAARIGRPTAGSTLYSTTFPCHMCARHIVAAGISRVVYIEPYHKSLSRELYPDSVLHDETDITSKGGVKFESFSGVTPLAYQTVFAKGRRKTVEGEAVQWDKTMAVPVAIGSNDYLTREKLALAQFKHHSDAPKVKTD